MNQLVNLLSEYGLYLGIPLVFLAVVAWIYRSSAKKRYEHDEEIPFREDEKLEYPQQSGL